VSAVTVNGTAVTDWTLKKRGGLLLRGVAGAVPRPVWPLGRANIVVTMSYGFTDVPRSVRMVALGLAERIALQGPEISEAIGDVSVRFAIAATELTGAEKLVLQNLRAARSS